MTFLALIKMSSKIIFYLLIVTTKLCVSQDYESIDDIPIESYDHGDHEENHMDLELLPRRQGRSFSSSGEDPKEFFFRSMSSFDNEDDVRTFGPYQNIPRPTFQTTVQGHDKRKKRNTADPVFVTGKEETSVSEIIQKLGKPLEVVPLDTKKLMEKEDKAENKMALEGQKSDEDNMSINDFIRFKRSASENLETKVADSDNIGRKINPLSEKLLMESSNEDDNRESRGATQKHWTKQIYPVRKSDELSFEDNIPSSSENVRAPRVHFVTQKFADSGPAPSELRPYEREARSRNLDRAPPRELARDLDRDLGRDTMFYERRFRHYDMPALERDRPYRDEMYSRYDLRDPRDMYHVRNENYDKIRSEYPASLQKPQKRIIYYATLPEISRSPPNVDLRDRYRYERDRFDDRYLSDQYRFRKTYPKSRYEEEGKTPYPVKVLTDVNVREVKKNPERRIYSEVDRSRYAHNTPTYRETDG